MPIQGPEVVITANTSQATASVDKMMRHIDATMNKVVGKTESHLNKVTRSVDRGFGQVSRSVRRSLLGISAIFAALFGHRMVQQIFATTNAFQGLANVFATFSENGQEAGQQMEFLTAESQRLGFEITTLGAAYQKMYAAGRITGFSAEKIQEIFSAVGEAAAVAGMDSRQFEGALRALHQMMSKGKVQAEELRGQLGEHLPGAFEIAAEAMGVTTKELDKMLSKGDVSAIKLFERFPEVLREKYGPGLATALNLPRRELERLKNDIQLAIKSVDDGVNALFASILSTTRRMLSGITGLFDAEFEETLKVVAAHIHAIPEMFRATVKLITEYFRPLYPAIQTLAEWMSSAFDATVDWIKGSFSGLGEFIGWTFQYLPSVVAYSMRKIGHMFGFMVEAISNLWTDGIDYIAAKFNSWLLSLQVGLKSIRVFFSDMMVSVVEVVDSGLQGLAEKIIGLADLASVVMPDSWAQGIRDAGIAISASSADFIAEMREGNNQVFAELQDLQDAKAAAGTKAEDLLARLVRHQVENYELYTDMELENMQQLFNEIQNTNQAGREFSLEVQNAIDYYDNLISASEMERDLMTETADNAGRLNQNLGKTVELTDEVKDMFSEIGDIFSNALTSAFDDFIDTGKFSIEQFINDITKDFLKLQFKTLITDPLTKALTDGLQQGVTATDASGALEQMMSGIIGKMTGMFSNLFSSFGSFFGGFFADGGVFNQTGVTPFANGGTFTNQIVDQPTLFKFANGAGVMGEAGPEAIMPLKRGPGGKLGVETSGSNQANFNVTIQTPNKDSFVASDAQLAEMFVNMAQRARRNM